MLFLSAPLWEYAINDVPRQKVVFVDIERLFLYHLCILSVLMAAIYRLKSYQSTTDHIRKQIGFETHQKYPGMFTYPQIFLACTAGGLIAHKSYFPLRVSFQ